MPYDTEVLSKLVGPLSRIYLPETDEIPSTIFIVDGIFNALRCSATVLYGSLDDCLHYDE